MDGVCVLGCGASQGGLHSVCIQVNSPLILKREHAVLLMGWAAQVQCVLVHVATAALSNRLLLLSQPPPGTIVSLSRPSSCVTWRCL